MEEKECSRCHVLKPAEQFFKKKRGKGGLDSYCKTCRNHHTSIRKFNNIKKISRGYNQDLMEAVSKELGIPFDKVKEVIVAQSVATKTFMNQGLIIKWSYVGKFCPRQASLFKSKTRANNKIKPPEKDAETI